MLAAALGNTNIVDELLKRGADVNAQDKVRSFKIYYIYEGRGEGGMKEREGTGMEGKDRGRKGCL